MTCHDWCMSGASSNDPGKTEVATSTVLSVGVTAVGLVLSAGQLGPEGAALLAAASGPVAGVLAASFARRLLRGQDFIAEVLRRTGKTEPELADWADSHPARTDLLNAAVTAAHGVGDGVSEKIRVMAQALADGVLRDDPAMLDHDLLVIQALDALERSHLVALTGLVENEGPGHWRHLVLSWDEWVNRVRYSSSSMTRIESLLVREGMLEVYVYPVDDVEDPQLPNHAQQGKYFAVSQFGFDLFEKLHEVWSEEVPPD